MQHGNGPGVSAITDLVLSAWRKVAHASRPPTLVHLGCGDGQLLQRLYHRVTQDALPHEGVRPEVFLVGVEEEPALLGQAEAHLAGLPHHLLHDGLDTPQLLAEHLRALGVEAPEGALYVALGSPPMGSGHGVRHWVRGFATHAAEWASLFQDSGLVLQVALGGKPIAKAPGEAGDPLAPDRLWLAAAAAGLFARAECFSLSPGSGAEGKRALSWLERRPYRVRLAGMEDLPALIDLEAACWPQELRTGAEELRRRLRRFPEGQCVVELAGRVAGAIYAQRIRDLAEVRRHTSETVAALHDAAGSVLQLLAVNVFPDMQDKGLGDHLLEFMLQYGSLLPGVERIAAVSLCRQYNDHTGLSLEEYIRARDAHGSLLDPILRFHQSHGAVIAGPVPGYRPKDTANQGYGVLVTYDMAHRQPLRAQPRQAAESPEAVPQTMSAVQEVVQAAVQSLLSDAADFAPQRPLRDMGFDSLAILALSDILSQRLAIDVSPTFFFNFSTPASITAECARLAGILEPTGSAALATMDTAPSQTIQPRRSAQGASRVSGAFPPAAVAVIGMACRFPGGANDPAAFWALLRDGMDAITVVPAWRWDATVSRSAATRYGGFLEDVEYFDAEFFQIAPREACYIDPQQRLLLELTWEALERAGIAPTSLKGSQTGIFVGVFTHDYQFLQVKTAARLGIDAYFGTGGSPAVVAGRIAYVLGCQGPTMAIDTACSSSLVAVHLACQSLRLGESDLAVAAGVNLLLSPELSLAFASSGMLASDGRCKTFSCRADGYVRSEGAGVLILKPLATAMADGDNIVAVIRGTAVNQDGASNGLTAPHGAAQAEVIHKALTTAGVEAATVSYVEAHGTGTPLGDPIEVSALGAVYGQGRALEQPLYLGSVKTNIGHTEAAAGIAGLMKVALALHHACIPRHLHCASPNPLLPLASIPAVIPQQSTPWPAPPDGSPRCAGVSAFGFSGTNAHAILEEPPQRPQLPSPPVRSVHLLALSATSQTALRALAARYVTHVQHHPEQQLADVCYTANTGRAQLPHRLAIPCHDHAGLLANLNAFVAGHPTSNTSLGAGSAQPPKIAFLFTGQGAQYLGMGRELFETEPVFRHQIDQCDALLRPYLHCSLSDLLYAEPGPQPLLDDTMYTQPALFALEYALAVLWRSWGIEPAAVLGHSVGEYAAACLAGVFSLADGLKLIAARGRLMQDLPRTGAMAAVFAPAAQVEAALHPYRDVVALAALNGPKNTVISGRSDVLEQVLTALARAGVTATRLRVSHAFHSPLMDPMLADFATVAQEVAYALPRCAFIANVSGAPAGSAVTSPAYWVDHVRQPVRFAAGLTSLAQAGYDCFVEVGPRPVLITMGRQCVPAATTAWLPSLQAGVSDWSQLLRSLAALYVRGAPVAWAGLYHHRAYQRLELPTYPFQRQRYWLATTAPAAAEDATTPWPYGLAWHRGSTTAAMGSPLVGHGAWLLFADRQRTAQALVQRLEAAGARCFQVRVGTEAKRVAPSVWTCDPADRHACRDIVRQILAETDAGLQGVVYLWSLDVAANDTLDATHLDEARKLACEGPLYLVQTLAELGQTPRLWLVTRGAQAPAGRRTAPQVASAPLWGLARTITLEHPAYHCTTIDLDPDTACEDVGALYEALTWPNEEAHLALCGSTVVLARLTPVSPPPADPQPVFHAAATYLITGGLGGIGRQLARHLLSLGARNLVLTGRHAPDAEGQAVVARLQEGGARVLFVPADMANEDDVRRTLDTVATHLPPLRGVFHTAGILDDGVLLHQTGERFKRVMAAKVHGAWHLHSLTRDLQYFVCFSSAAALLGAPGQSNYAAANAFMDALATWRRAAGLPGLSVQWGPWEGSGMAADLSQRHQHHLAAMGWLAVPPRTGLDLLTRLLNGHLSQVAVMPLDVTRFLDQFPQASRFLSELEAHPPRTLLATQDAAVAAPLPSGMARPLHYAAAERRASLATRLTTAAVDDRRTLLQAYMREVVAHTLALESGALGLDKPLQQLGIDSLMATQLRNSIYADLGLEVPMVAFMSDTSLTEFAAHLHELLRGNHAALGSDTADPVTTPVGHAGVGEDSSAHESEWIEGEV